LATAALQAAQRPTAREGERAADPTRDLIADAWRFIRRAVLTDAALPDREHRWLTGPHGAMPIPVREPGESYGYEEPRPPRFQPTPADVGRYLEVLAWLNWLKSQPGDGPRQVRVLIARSYRLPVWKIAARIGRSDDTVRRIEAAALAAIVNRFQSEIEALR
jgi:hypothetical protein